MDRNHHYKIHHKLGSRQSASFYYASVTNLALPVVIKLVHQTRASEDNMSELFLEEALLASAIQHPNIIAIYEVSEYKNRPYIVMQYVPGRTLKEIISQGPLSLQFAMSISIQITAG